MVMTWVALIFTPVVLAYQGWTYWVFSRRLTRADVSGAAAAAVASDGGPAGIGGPRTAPAAPGDGKQQPPAPSADGREAA